MNKFIKKSLSLLLVLLMVISFLPQITLQSNAANVDYVYSGKYIYNWGQRGTTATYLSQNAEAFYTDNGTSYEELSALNGSSNTSSVPFSALYMELKSLMTDAQTKITSYDDTRDLFKYTDCQNSGGKISSFYSGKEIGPNWDGGATWNREHTWPNSKGEGSAEDDIMMLRPTSKSENSSRGNDAYGESSNFYDPNVASKGQYNLRGDVARIMLFVYTRWGNTGSMWGSGGVMESREVLLKWMEEDPVDTWELGRNDAVESITGTRNVYVDYPELVFILFDEPIPADYDTPSGKGAGSSYTITATSNNTSYGTVSVSGHNINASPKTGYYASGYTVVSGTAQVTQNNNVFTVNPSSDCTIRINFAAKTSLSLSFSENGNITQTKSVYAGDSTALPSPQASVDDAYTFIGWTTGSVSDTENKPGTVHLAGSAYTVSAAQTLYALYTYRDNEGGTGNVFEPFSGTLEEGDYIFIYEISGAHRAMKAEVVDNRLYHSEVTLENNSIESPIADIIWHIAPTNGGFTIYNKSKSSYAASTGTKNQAILKSSESDYTKWTVTGDSTYDFTNVANKNKNINANLRLNGDLGFACYAQNFNKPLTLYKSTNSTTYYTTTATTCKHTNTEQVLAKDATCTAEGYTAGVYCKDCQTYISGHETLAMRDHDFDRWFTATSAGCETTGMKTKTCQVCQYQESEVIPATGHSYDTSVVTQPTAATPGYTTRTCSKCGNSEKIDITYLVSFSTPAGVNAVAAQICGEDGITLPVAKAPAGEENYTFVGWTTELTANSTERPEVYTTTYNATNCITLYALYSYEVKGSGSGDYVKVTNAPENWSGEYVIVYEAGSRIFDGSLTKMDVANNCQSVTITENTIPAAQADAYKFTIAAVTGGYSIQSASGIFIGRTSTSNGLNEDSAPYINTFSLNDDGTINIIGSAGTYLRFNDASNQMRFRYYGSGQKPISLYVKDGSSGTTHYTTVGTVEKPIISASLTLDSILGVNFKINAPQGSTVKIAVGGVDTEYTVNNGTYTVSVMAQDMMKDIVATVYDGDAVIATETFKLANYVAAIEASETETTATKNLATATLNYCQNAARVKGNYDGTMNPLEAIPEDAFTAHTVTIAEESTLKAASLYCYLDEDCELRLRLKSDKYTVYVDGTALDKKQSGDTWVYGIDKLLAQNYDDAYTFVVQDGDNTVLTVSGSVLAYIGACLNKNIGTEAQQKLLISMYHYYVAAAAYETAGG